MNGENILPQVVIMGVSLDTEGPTKGAVALANGLVENYPVTFIVLKSKKTTPEELALNPKVKIHVANGPGWVRKYFDLMKLFRSMKRNGKIILISYCYAADMMSFLSIGKNIVKISSMRANLWQNYFYKFKHPGLVMAWLHYKVVSYFDYVVAISGQMTQMLRSYGLSSVVHINNFIDERSLDRFKDSIREHERTKRHFCFLGSLTNRKRPELILEAANQLAKEGFDFHIHFIGDGQMFESLMEYARNNGLENRVTFHGHLNNPYPIIQLSDYCILPSESEGVSRAVMESLYYGLPCIVRDRDSASEIIHNGKNGYLFSEDNELHGIMKTVLSSEDERLKRPRNPLLPPEFRMKHAVELHMRLIDGI